MLLGEGASAADVAAQVRATAALDDVGVRVRVVGQGSSLAVESETGLVGEPLSAGRVRGGRGVEAGPPPASSPTSPTACASARARSRTRWSRRSTTRCSRSGECAPARDGASPIVLNDWTARQLRASIGGRLQLEYYLWREEGRLETAIGGVHRRRDRAHDGPRRRPRPGARVPGNHDRAASRRLGPAVPPGPRPGAAGGRGVLGPLPRDAQGLHPPRRRPAALGPSPGAPDVRSRERRRWRRVGGRVRRRPAPPSGSARRSASPLDPVRERALASAQGATDFGAYFTYFSFFLVVAALLLAALFFRLGLEQRAPELGLMRAVGFGPEPTSAGSSCPRRRSCPWPARRSGVGGGGCLGRGADGRAAHVVGRRGGHARSDPSPGDPRPSRWAPIIAVACAIGCAAWTLRDLARASPRALLAGRRAARDERPAPRVVGGAGPAGRGGRPRPPPPRPASSRWCRGSSAAPSSCWPHRWPRPGPGSGAPRARVRRRRGSRASWWLGMRGAGYRPGRSTLCIALIAFATFLVVAVGTFRRDAEAEAGRATGSGGYALIAESLIPIHHDLATKEGRAEMGLGADWPVPPRGALPSARRRRCELPEPLRATEPADRRARGAFPGRRRVPLPRRRGRHRRREGEPVAAPAARRSRRARCRSSPMPRRWSTCCIASWATSS